MISPSPEEILVERFGSPLFVYDAEVVRERWRALREALPPDVDIYYAVKANPSLAVLALLRSLGAGAEIASAGELQAALRAGFSPERILFAGPGKRRDELEGAVRAGVRAVHAESEAEILRLHEIGLARGEPVRAGVRVHVPWGAAESRRIIGGGEATKFGIEEARARAEAARWSTLEGVRLASLHVFNASNVLDAGALVQGAARTAALAADLAAAGLPIETVDVGGGLGVPYAPDESPLDLDRLGQGFAALRDRHRGDFTRGLRLAIEPGRFLVAEAGVYLTRVLDRKTCGGVRFLVVDGGIHHLLRPALVEQRHPVRRAGGGEGATGAFRVCGPLCTSLDTFGDHDLPEETGPGDLLAVELAGAYGFTEAMPGFLSHPVPAEVLLLGGRPFLARSRRAADSHLEGQEIPPALS